MNLFFGSGRLRKLGFVYLLILLGAIWLATNRRYSWEDADILERTASEAQFEVRELLLRYEMDGRDGLESALAERLEWGESDGDPYARERYYRLMGADGVVVVGNIPDWEAANVRQLGEGVFQLSDVDRPGVPGWWTLSWFWGGSYNPDYDLVVIERALPDGGRLYVGRDSEFWSEMYIFFVVTSWGLVVVTLVALLAGMMTSRSILKNLGKINGLVQDIVRTKDLTKRIPDGGEGEEFRETIAQLNLMLGKIDESMASIREASNSIAHDMRTPLTRLRNRLDSIVEEGRAVESEEVASLMEEVDSLLATFRSILRITQLELHPERLDRTRMDLSVLLRDAAELYAPVAGAKGQKIEVEAEALELEMDVNLMFQLVSNLLDNACKYSPRESVVRCGVLAGKESGFYVRDMGIGIPAEERDLVFTRFYRMEKSRASEGVGLGLSMVEAIARAHGAVVSLHDGNPGLRVEVRFIKSF